MQVIENARLIQMESCEPKVAFASAAKPLFSSDQVPMEYGCPVEASGFRQLKHQQPFPRVREKGCILLILMVGAGRFERPTPCAQGSLRQERKTPSFQVLTFQAVGSTPLQLFEPC
jgi:hypothetical protein